MNNANVIIKVAALVACSAMFAGCISASSSASSQANVSKRREDTLLRYLDEVGFQAHSRVSISYYTECRLQELPSVLFPAIRIDPPTDGLSGIGAVRSILKDNDNITVAKDASGVIRISIGVVPQDILDTYVSDIHFTEVERYNPVLAVAKVLGAPNVTLVARKHDVSFAVFTFSYLLTQPDPKLPHLPRNITHSTVRDALEKIATTFNGYAIYGVCQKNNGERVVYARITWPAAATLPRHDK